ncbi:unnamed protein product [Calypogeia fissa]
MCTVDGTPWWTSGGIRAGAPWNPADLHFNSTHVQIKELEDRTVVAHLQGLVISKNHLTKGDIEAEAVGYLASELTGTGVDKFLRGDFERYWRQEIPFLLESEAAFAMKVFNKNPSTPLTPADAAKVKPILLPIVDAAFRGAFEVVSLLKNQKGKSFNWPSILQNPKQRIYVKDCLHLPFRNFAGNAAHLV